MKDPPGSSVPSAAPPVRRVSLRTKILLGFAVPLAAVVVTSIVVHQAVTVGMSAADDVARTNQRVAGVNALLNVVVDAGAGERTFVITGDSRALAPYTVAPDLFASAAADLRRRLVGNPAQLVRIARLEHLFNLWRESAADPEIRARRSVPFALLAAARSADIALLHVWQAEADYDVTRTPDALARWQSELVTFRLDLFRILNLETNPQRTATWRRVLSLTNKYETAFLRAVSARSEGPVRRALSRSEQDALAGMVSGMNRSYEGEETHLTEMITSGASAALVAKMRQLADGFVQTERQQLQALVLASRRATRWSATLVLAGPGAAMGLALLVTLMISLRIAKSIGAVARAAQGLAAGDLSLRVPVHSNDEVGVMAQAFNVLADRLSAWTHEVTLLGQMSDSLQACSTTKEAYEVIERIAGQLFPAEAGGVFMVSPSRDLAERVVFWGRAAADAEEVFAPDACWALRRGQINLALDGRSALLCKHVGSPPPAAYMCIPLVAHGEALGILHVQCPPSAASPGPFLTEDQQRLARTVAERVSLALANMRLQETLRRQSIRDALTGLFNRRYLEETLQREIRRATRAGQPVGIILIDLDHFKQFNDTFGHGAGDALLREFGLYLQKSFRGEDIVCRYGGEEFVVILAGASLENTLRRAEGLREGAKRLHVVHRGQSLGVITLSIGAAVFPDHGLLGEALLRAADTALYAAKEGGRDRVIVAQGADLPGHVPAG